MYLFSNIKSECCGCKACAAICPRNCISFKEDDESFVYPIRDITKCIECHLCDDVCPGTAEIEKYNPICCKVGVHKKWEIIENSSSGGAFTAICELLQPLGYKIYGAKFDEYMRCVFDDSENSNGYELFRKSKYLQADTNDIYSKISNDLKNNVKVLFSGLPCQVAGLRLFLKKRKIDTTNLFIIEILCHGVTSQSLFNDYLEELGKKNENVVKKIVFRNKKQFNGEVNSRSIEVEFENNSSQIIGLYDCPFLVGYNARLIYRPSCYACPFASARRVGDVTIADAWGVDALYPEFRSLSGVSLIIANTKAGQGLVNQLNNMDLKSVDLQWAVSHNDTLREPTVLHPKRELFFKNWHKIGFSQAVNKYAIPPLYLRAWNKFKRTVKRIF